MRTKMQPKRDIVDFLILGTLLSGLSTQLGAQVLSSSIRACREQADDVRRLKCYDLEVDKVQVPSPDGPKAHGVRSESDQSSATAVRLPMFTAKIAGLRFRRSGELVVNLDNGQVWTQYVREGKVPLGVGDTVTIRPGWLGSYLLVAPSKWITKVHELKAAGAEE